MTIADSVKAWADTLDPKAYSGFLTAALLVVAFTVFGFLPPQSLLAVNALLSGVIWTACMGLIIVGGARVDRVYYAAACLIAGGLMLSTPSLFVEESPVEWGSSLSRLGFAIFFVWSCVDMANRWRHSEAGSV